MWQISIYTIHVYWCFGVGKGGIISSSLRQLLSEWKTGKELWKLSHFAHSSKYNLGTSEYSERLTLELGASTVQ